jgi:hypothetical protein
MVYASVDLSSNFSIEGFYQYEWQEIVIDPPGTYFSTNDFVGPGGTTVFLNWGESADTGESPGFIQPPIEPFLGVGRDPTGEPDDGGQYGVAFRLFVPSWGGTEFGFYYINYHSRLPTINAHTGPMSAVPEMNARGGAAALLVYAAAGVPPGVSPIVDAQASAAATAAGTAVWASYAKWFTEYPEDIKLYGFSWNAQLGTSGIAFQGEVSYRQDNPLQADDVELLFAANSPVLPALGIFGQFGPQGFDQRIEGFRRLDTSQLQFTLTKIFSNFLGADQGVILGEFGFNKVFDMPSKDELRFEGPGTYVSGNPIMASPAGAHAGKPAEDWEHFADDFSWGYRLVSRLTYNNAIGAWSLSPRISWQHDPKGNTPAPGGSFLEGRQALSIGIQAGYQNAWQVDLSYTQYSGASRYNLIHDRDFIGGYIKFSF